MAKSDFEGFSSPLLKLAKFFRSSRNQWKAKCRSAKEEIKRRTNQQRAAEQSRQMWRQRAEDAERQIQELEQTVEALKRHAHAASHSPA